MSQRTPSTHAQELESIMEELPAEKVEELLDFAHYLYQRYTPQPARGSADAILKTMEMVGPLQFEAGELDTLLEELNNMRRLDESIHDELPA
jgi:hypothetical protein